MRKIMLKINGVSIFGNKNAKLNVFLFMRNTSQIVLWISLRMSVILLRIKVKKPLKNDTKMRKRKLRVSKNSGI